MLGGMSSGAVHQIASSLPFPLLGLDSGNGGEFISHYLYCYCQCEGITFTRSRPCKKDDNSQVEQKNWMVIRRLVGLYGTPARHEATV